MAEDINNVLTTLRVTGAQFATAKIEGYADLFDENKKSTGNEGLIESLKEKCLSDISFIGTDGKHQAKLPDGTKLGNNYEYSQKLIQSLKTLKETNPDTTLYDAIETILQSPNGFPTDMSQSACSGLGMNKQHFGTFTQVLFSHIQQKKKSLSAENKEKLSNLDPMDLYHDNAAKKHYLQIINPINDIVLYLVTDIYSQDQSLKLDKKKINEIIELSTKLSQQFKEIRTYRPNFGPEELQQAFASQTSATLPEFNLPTYYSAYTLLDMLIKVVVRLCEYITNLTSQQSARVSPMSCEYGNVETHAHRTFKPGGDTRREPGSPTGVEGFDRAGNDATLGF